MEIKDGLSAASFEALSKDNYVAWSVRVKTYLMAQDLWEIVEATTEPPKQEYDEAAFNAWSKKNSMALNVIQVSCGPNALSMITQISLAKIAWNTLGLEVSLSLSLSLSLSHSHTHTFKNAHAFSNKGCF